MISKQAYKVTVLETHYQEQYQVSAALERYRILRDMHKGQEPITVYLPNEEGKPSAEHYFVSSLVDIDKDGLSILLESAQQPELTAMAIRAPYLLCATQLNKVKIEFRLEQPLAAQHEGQDVIKTPVPEVLVRVQRREYYRLLIPYNVLLQCSIRTENNELRLDLADISCGGIGGKFEDVDFDLPPGMVLEDCQLDIPQVGAVTVDLQVRNSFKRIEGNGREVRHIGFAFVDLPDYAVNAIQRFIYTREREQAKK